MPFDQSNRVSYDRSVISDLLQQADAALAAQEHAACTALVQEVYALFDAALVDRVVQAPRRAATPRPVPERRRVAAGR